VVTTWRMGRYDEDSVLMATEEEQYMETILFVFIVTWWRRVGDTRSRENEYEFVRSRLPLGSGFIMKCDEVVMKFEDRVRYDALIVLRGQLATVGEVKAWLDCGENWCVDAPSEGQSFEEFVRYGESQCKLDKGKTYGERINMKEGDEEVNRRTCLLREAVARGSEVGDEDE